MAPSGVVGIPKRVQGRLLVKIQPSYNRRTQYFGDASLMERPPRTAAAKERSQPESRRQAVVVAEGGTGEVTQALRRSPDSCE